MHLGGHRLAGAGLAREQDLQALGARDGLLVAPVGEHAVAVAQVGADRLQQLALALGDDEVLPLVAGREPGGELAEAERGGLARAGVEVDGARARSAPRAVADRRATSAASTIWVIESRNFAATSPVSVEPVRSAHAWRRSAKDGERGLDQQHGALAERERGGAGRRGQDRALGAGLDRAQQPPAFAGLDVLEPFEDDRPVLERGDQRGLGHHARGRRCRLTWTATSGGRSASASSVSASGPASTTGRWLGRASSAAIVSTASSRPGSCDGRVDHAAAASAGRTRPCARRAAPRRAGRRP